MRVVGLVSLVSFLASCAFHLAAFVPLIPARFLAASFLLHAVTLILCAIALGQFVLHKRNASDLSVRGVFARWRSTLQNEEGFRETVIGFIPLPAKVVCILMVVNAFANFILFGMSTNRQEPTAGQVVRFFSSGWMVFLLFPTIYFLIIRPRLLALEKPHKHAA